MAVVGTQAVIAVGASGLRPGDFTDPAHPSFGFENFLMSTPPLGGDYSLTDLRTNLSNAADSKGKLKGDALYVHALLGARVVDPSINFSNFDGFVVVIEGSPGRGESFPAPSLSFEGQTVNFNESKGLSWLPSHPNPGVRTTWGRKAHELGHWFVMPDIYTEWYENGTVKVGSAEEWDMAGDHDTGPLFSGHQADHMQLFDASNIARRTWDPSAGPTNETFEIAAHAAIEDGTARITYWN